MKLPKCKVCREEYQRLRPLQRVCGIACAVVDGKAQAERARTKDAALVRSQDRAARISIKPRAQWLKEAQASFNAWVRARDADKPCISCGRHHAGQYHAGHYLSTGARPELRFHPDNAHRQCQPCNTHLHGNLVLYRAALIGRIGLERVEWLEGPHQAAHYGVDELKAIKAKYAKAAREIAQTVGELMP